MTEDPWAEVKREQQQKKKKKKRSFFDRLKSKPRKRRAVTKQRTSWPKARARLRPRLSFSGFKSVVTGVLLLFYAALSIMVVSTFTVFLLVSLPTMWILISYLEMKSTLNKGTEQYE